VDPNDEGVIKVDDKKLSVSDIEDKIQERLEYLERHGKYERIGELGLLMDWILNGSEY
jgi:hypothetical protein